MTTNPHDKLFKAAFSEPSVVASLIEDLFPAELATAIRLDSLTLSNASYIDESLNEHFADLVYDCQFNGSQSVQIALLLEHKSYTVRHPHLQLLRYLMNRWQQDVEHNQALTPTIAVIIYHGEAPWPYKPFSASLASSDPALEPFFPEFDYLLINLSALSDQEIVAFKSQFLALSAAMMKHRNDKAFDTFLATVVAPLLGRIAEADLERIISPLFVYALEVSELTGKEIISIFRRTNQTETTMTTLERFHYEMTKIGREEGLEEGREKGREEGRREGRQEAIYNTVKGALKLGMDAPTMAATFEFSLEDVENVLRQLQNEQA